MASLTDKIRDSVKSAIANGEDLTQPSNRTSFLKKFIEDHNDDNSVPKDIKSLRPTANKVFEDELGKNNLEMKKQTQQTTKYNKKLASEIAAKTTEKKSGIQDKKLEKKDDTKQETKTDDTKQLQKTETGVKEPIYDHWTTRGVGAVFDAMLTPLRAAWPETPPLSDDTKEALGEMWLPAFQRYGDEKLQFLVFPAIGTIGLLAPVVIEGRKKHKETEEKKKKKKQDDKLTAEEEERVNKLTCKWCDKLFDSAHIVAHQNTCPKRKSL